MQYDNFTYQFCISSASFSPMSLRADYTAPSCSSAAADTLSLDASWKDHDDKSQIIFPFYDVRYYGQGEDLEPPASHWIGDSHTASPASHSISTNASTLEFPDPVEYAEDDTAVRTQPSRNVDYLSHNWTEEEIWSSWKHVVLKRKAYSNSTRLENASWRAWTKSKNKLKTVSPESLNWLRDCDVTWLYGPLQTGSDRSLRMPSSSPASSSCISNLKSSLLKQQAAAVVQPRAGRRCDQTGIGRATSGSVTFPFSLRRMSSGNSSLLPSVSSSGLEPPGTGEEKHIHFNEQVEQRIALEMMGDEDEELGSHAIHDCDDSDSDDGVIMMKRTNPKPNLSLRSRRKATPWARFNSDSKTIAMLPSTTLKPREGTLVPLETTPKYNNGSWNGGKLSSHLSQEALGLLKPPTLILLGDSLKDDDADIDWQPPRALASCKYSMAITQERLQNLHASGSSSSLNGDPPGMRRTPSGMFMPCDEDNDDVVSGGLFGKVVDAVNTAKDMAHVVWNAGWR
ncbi:hypothetical protein L207DRAFT_445164 [Hyaloscypha variabilis F]|uniref:Nitrogen regulatory protein areA GATA-like domain-containing protein n=1 Tax=Hyaloscypha variabilis (strain UAMH 11265 / GT02V1 / F) TaxID=1149755 RepID=A0A2J6QTK5_HYAVF|nr:hypothetical protein L207DRAFT_445164 [Hyaloscypha variabilis F]